MSKKTKGVLAVAVLALLVGVWGAAAVWAQDPQPPTDPSAPWMGNRGDWNDRGARVGRSGPMMMGGRGVNGASLASVVAEQVGLTLPELQAELQAG